MVNLANTHTHTQSIPGEKVVFKYLQYIFIFIHATINEKREHIFEREQESCMGWDGGKRRCGEMM